jgi:hypothetical protein
MAGSDLDSEFPNSSVQAMTPNHSIEPTATSTLRVLAAAAHVER